MKLGWVGIVLSLAAVAVAQEAAPAKPAPPGAQEPPAKQEDVKEYKIIATDPLKGTLLFDTPYSADIVTGGDIRNRRLSRTLPESIKESPGVSVQKTGPGQASPFIRGWTGYRNLMLIDGIRLNNSTFREGPNQYWSTVDPYLIDRAELIRGPASVLYGSDAIGGTLYAHTIEPTLEAGTHVHSRSFYRYSGGEDSQTARQEFSGNFDDFGWLLGGTYRDFGDISGGRHYGNMKGTAYDQYSGDVKFLARLSPASKLVLAFQHDRTGEAPRWHSTVDSRSWHGTLPGSDLERDFDQGRNLGYLQYHWAAEGGLVDAFKASVSWHRQTEREDRTTATQVEVNEFKVDTPGAWVQLAKRTGIGYFTLGSEYYRDSVGSDAYFRSGAGRTHFERGPVADDATYDSFGVYLQDEITVGDFEVVPGVRYSRSEVDAEQVDNREGDAVVINPIEDTYSAVTGSLRLLYHVTENWNAIAGWGMGFRAPSLNDTTSFRLQLNQVFDIPSEGLDPETFHTFDLGVRAKYSSWQASAFGFYTIIDDFIGRVPSALTPADLGLPPGTVILEKDNLGDGWVYGFEIALAYRLTEEVTAFGDWGYARGRVEQIKSTAPPFEVDDDPMGKVGPNTVHVGLRYEPKGSRVWVEGLVTVADRQSHLSFQEGLPGGAGDGQRIPGKHGTPGYTVYTVRGGWAVTEHLTTTVAVENVTDKDYRQHGSGVNEPGTNFIFGADVRF
jgi:hemoglobin/transferrin/lactoferrin receptor protein